jgi:serine/threonine protein kinase
VTEPVSQPDALIGKTLRTYRIQEQIGASRWGKVYRAFQSTMSRTAAVRVLAPELAARRDQTEQFLEESSADARMVHPHLVLIYQAGQAEGTYFCAMEYMDGPPLPEFLRDGDDVNEHHLLQTIVGVARALDFLWHRQVPHQPPLEKNVLTMTDGTVKLINIQPVEAPPSQSTQEDLMKLGVMVATLVNNIAPVRKPISRLVERMVGMEDREPFSSLAEAANAAEALDQKLFPSADFGDPTAEKPESRTIKPMVAAAIVGGSLILLLVAVTLWFRWHGPVR